MHLYVYDCVIHWDVHVGYSGLRCCAHNFGTAGCVCKIHIYFYYRLLPPQIIPTMMEISLPVKADIYY